MNNPKISHIMSREHFIKRNPANGLVKLVMLAAKARGLAIPCVIGPTQLLAPFKGYTSSLARFSLIDPLWKDG
jgi:hypothetical protein